MQELLSTGQVAKALGLHHYQFEYLISTGAVQDTPCRVAGKRAWTSAQIEAIRKLLIAKGKRTQK